MTVVNSILNKAEINVLLIQNLPVACMSGRKPRSLPKQAVAYLDADKITRTSDAVKRLTFQIMLYDDDIYNHDKHNHIWHEGLAIFMYEIVALKSRGGPYRQTTHNARLFTTSDLLKNDRLMLLSVKNRLFRTTYEQASTKTQKPRTASPLSWFTDKSSVSKALIPPSDDGIAPAKATETFYENHQSRHGYIMNKSLKKIR